MVVGCSTTLNKLAYMKEHARSHSQEKVVACWRCGANFASTTRLKMHIERQSPLNNSE